MGSRIAREQRAQFDEQFHFFRIALMAIFFSIEMDSFPRNEAFQFSYHRLKLCHTALSKFKYKFMVQTNRPGYRSIRE